MTFLVLPGVGDGDLPRVPAVLTVVPDPATGTVGSLPPTLGYQLTGFRNGDTPRSPPARRRAPRRRTRRHTRGTYPVTCTAGNLSAANYVFTVGAPPS